LSYSRHIINSPITVEIYPGAVDNITSSAVGSKYTPNGLTECTTLHECSFVIQARDSNGNNIYNDGNVNWNISIRGVGDWAGFNGGTHSRINELNYTRVRKIDYAVEPLGWRLVGPANITYYDKFLYIFHDASNQVERGDTIKVGQETMLVTEEVELLNVFTTVGGLNRYSRVPLARPYLGDTIQNFNLYRLTNDNYKCSNCSTGKYLVRYFPTVRGYYHINVATRSVNEVQFVEIISTSKSLGGSFT